MLLAALLTLPARAETPAPPAAPAPASSAPASGEISENQVIAVLGLAAMAQDGKDIGRIVDILVDRNGRPRAAVIDVGGFLGMGNRKVAIDWSALRFDMGKAHATLDLNADRIKGAPAYDPGKPVEALGVPAPAPTTAKPPPPPSALAPAAPASPAPAAVPAQ